MELSSLLAAAAEIRDAQQAGENTADRVGTLLVNIIGKLCSTLPAAGITLKANAAGTGITVSYYTEEGTPVNRDVILPVATTTIPGLLSATDKAKLDAANGALATQDYANTAAANATNDSLTKSGFTLVHDIEGNYYNKDITATETSAAFELKTGNDTTAKMTIPAATNSQAGVMSAADKTKLDGAAQTEEMLSRLQGRSSDTDATTDPFRKWPGELSSWGDVVHALDALMSISGLEQGQKAAGRWRLVYNGRLLHVDMYAQDFAQGYWVQVVSGAVKITETSATEYEFGHSNTPHTYWRRNFDNFVGDIGGEWCEVSASHSALANTYLSGGKPAIINGVINGQGQWIASGQGFSDCLVVPIIAGETIVVTYSEDVSLIDRSFFKSFDAETKEIVFAEGYSGNVSNNGTYRVVTRVAPDDASFFYTAYNRTKIISITVGGVEVYASTPASRLLQEELHVADLSRQALRTSDLTLSVGSNLADKEKITTGYISSAGSIVNAADWKRIAVDVSNIATGTKLTFGGFYLGRTGYWAFYRGGTASTDKISNGSYADPQGSSRPVTVEVPEGAVTLYITIFREGSSTTPTGWNTPYDELMCAIGETLPSYVPFVQTVSAIQGHPLVGTAAGGGGGGGDIVADLPLAPDGAGIDVGYAYIDSLTGAVKVKLSQTEQL